jgi:ATP-dependent Clp protease ATP-binding subunit ClpX
VLLNSMYELPSLDNVSKVVVDESVIEGDAEPFILYENKPKSVGAAD